jgi:hypothetical protein
VQEDLFEVRTGLGEIGARREVGHRAVATFFPRSMMMTRVHTSSTRKQGAMTAEWRAKTAPLDDRLAHAADASRVKSVSGSSNSSTDGCRKSPHAMTTFCRMPREAHPKRTLLPFNSSSASNVRARTSKSSTG